MAQAWSGVNRGRVHQSLLENGGKIKKRTASTAVIYVSQRHEEGVQNLATGSVLDCNKKT